jgi:hypothetical protein
MSLVSRSLHRSLFLGKPLRTHDGIVTGFWRGDGHGEQFRQSLWKLIDVGGDLLIVDDASDELEELAPLPDIGGNHDEGDVPYEIFLDGWAPVTARYCEVVPSSLGEPQPQGLRRRRAADAAGPLVEEEFRDRCWQPAARPTEGGGPLLVEIPERDAVTFVMVRLVQPGTDPLPRYKYWAYFAGGDPQRRIRVPYDIPGHGFGLYTRHADDRATGLIRFDRYERAGARLGTDGCWRLNEGPERNVWRGSDCGDPVSIPEAEQVAQALGHPAGVIYTSTEAGRR